MLEVVSINCGIINTGGGVGMYRKVSRLYRATIIPSGTRIGIDLMTEYTLPHFTLDERADK